MLYTCHSFFSLRYGLHAPEDLVRYASSKRVKTLAITDVNNSTAVIPFYKSCLESNVKPVAGIEFRYQNEHYFTGIAKNNEGFQELNAFLTAYLAGKINLEKRAPDFKNCFIIYPFTEDSRLYKLHHFEFIGVKPSRVNRLFSQESNLLDKMVIVQPFTFINQSDFEMHKHLRAVDRTTLLSKLEDSDLASADEFLTEQEKIVEIFERYPDIIERSEKIIGEIELFFSEEPKNKKCYTGKAEKDIELLRNLAFDGYKKRYEDDDGKIIQRVEKELSVIRELGFSAYFLITWDIIQFSKSRNFYHVGRGSGANSIVAYCLGITDVDPIELNLYFERFINPKRTSPPDFDIDFSWKERDIVLDYIFDRYPEQHVALLGTINTFQGKSIIRELGKVYGLPKEEIDQLIDHTGQFISESEIGRKIVELSLQFDSLPNYRSIHAGGVIISEQPITCFTALDDPPKGYPTTQWDMYTAEEIGYEKLDILSQRGIGHIGDAIEIILRNRNEEVDIHAISKIKEDELVRKQLKSGETIGCFYIESPAMRGLLKKLKCDDYLTLVAASSIIRPGVAKSGMMKAYIQRFHNPEGFDYLHPVMQEQLKETFGVMVYQEDVLKVCHHFAGLDLADADILRRAMSGKYRSKKEFRRIEQKFFSNCRERGYSEKLANEVWRQIESFAGYSFSKAHSASYAVESFQSLFLKVHYPCEFMTAVINNFGGFYRTWVYVNEAQKCGATIKLPCVNSSAYLTRIERHEIYLGFVHLQGLETQLSKRIVREREERGCFTDLNDFVERTAITREQLILLIRAGALRFTKKMKAELYWNAQMMFGQERNQPKHMTMFDAPEKHFQLPKLEHNVLEDAYDEIEMLGFPVSVNHFDMLQTRFRGEIKAAELNQKVGKTVKMVGKLVTIKYVRTIKKEIMNFGTFIDIDGDFFDTVHFPDSLKKYRFSGQGLYLILGKVVEEFGYASIEVHKMARLPMQPDPRGK